MSELELGSLGLVLNVADDRAHIEQAAEAERLGFSALWLFGGQLELLEPLAELLRATEKVAVAPAIVSLDVHGVDDVVRLVKVLGDGEAERLVGGFGAPQQAARPLAGLREFLDELDAADVSLPAGRRLVAALGPRKLELARDRAAGAITMLVTPGYTAWAREVLGPDATLVVIQPVVLDADLGRARQTVRGPLGFLLSVGGYAANMRRMGFGDDDIAAMSDELVDAIATVGDADAILAGVRAHLGRRSRPRGAVRVLGRRPAGCDRGGPRGRRRRPHPAEVVLGVRGASGSSAHLSMFRQGRGPPGAVGHRPET